METLGEDLWHSRPVLHSPYFLLPGGGVDLQKGEQYIPHVHLLSYQSSEHICPKVCQCQLLHNLWTSALDGPYWHTTSTVNIGSTLTLGWRNLRSFRKSWKSFVDFNVIVSQQRRRALGSYIYLLIRWHAGTNILCTGYLGPQWPRGRPPSVYGLFWTIYPCAPGRWTQVINITLLMNTITTKIFIRPTSWVSWSHMLHYAMLIGDVLARESTRKYTVAVK